MQPNTRKILDFAATAAITTVIVGIGYAAAVKGNLKPTPASLVNTADNAPITNEDGSAATWTDAFTDPGAVSVVATARDGQCHDLLYAYPTPPAKTPVDVTKCKITNNGNKFYNDLQRALSDSLAGICNTRPTTCVTQTGCRNGARSTIIPPKVTLGVTPGYPKDVPGGKKYCFTAVEMTCLSQLTCVRSE